MNKKIIIEDDENNSNDENDANNINNNKNNNENSNSGKNKHKNIHQNDDANNDESVDSKTTTIRNANTKFDKSTSQSLSRNNPTNNCSIENVDDPNFFSDNNSLKNQNKIIDANLSNENDRNQFDIIAQNEDIDQQSHSSHAASSSSNELSKPKGHTKSASISGRSCSSAYAPELAKIDNNPLLIESNTLTRPRFASFISFFVFVDLFRFPFNNFHFIFFSLIF